MKVHVAGGITKDVGAVIQVRFRAWEREVESATEDVQKIAMEEAVDLTSGPYTQRDLRRMGHPYSRRRPHGIGVSNPERINVTKGRIQRGWRYEFGARKRSVTLWNVADNARWMTGAGTRRMVPRRILKALVQRVYPRVIREYERPFRRLRW
jgi:hypothetical protein